MESSAVRRRVNTISAHFSAGIISEDLTSPTTHLFPLSCSSSISTAFRRRDNSLQFGRQSSASQGYFMRQQALFSMEQQSNQLRNGGDCGNINENKSTDSTPPLYSRLGTKEPSFARPVAESDFSSAGVLESIAQDMMLPASNCPKFARPIDEITEKKLNNSRIVSSQISGIHWSPRINVAESQRNYVLSVELPGVNIRDIRVEMDNKSLIVRGKRSMRWWGVEGCSGNNPSATYRKREISQGPYQVVWPLPAGANKDCISAEFMDGILQITIEKL